MTTLLYIAAAAALPTAQFFAFALLLPTAMLCLYGLYVHHHALWPALKSCVNNQRNRDITQGGISLLLAGIFTGVSVDIIILLVGWTPQISVVDRISDAFAGVLLICGLTVVTASRARNPRRLFLLAMSASAVSLCGAIIIEKAGM